MKKKKLPKIIKDVGFDFNWDEAKVWALDVPVEEMDISDLEWHFDIPFWWTDGGYYDFKPVWMLKNPDKYPERVKRVMGSDLQYPLDIVFWKGKWLLLDGLHRLVKAKMLGQDKVKVRKIPKEAISKIKK
jgi:hypothetical protein